MHCAITTAATGLRLFSSVPVPPAIRKLSHDCSDPLHQFDDVTIDEMRVKLYTFVVLAIDYMDTICDLGVTDSPIDIKKEARKLKELQREYMRFHSKEVGPKALEMEIDLATTFEMTYRDDFKRIKYAIDHELLKLRGSLFDDPMMMAYYDTLLMCRAAKQYSEYCDKWIRRHGIAYNYYDMLVQKEFLKMIPVVKEIGKKLGYPPLLSTMNNCAKILVTKIKLVKAL